MAGGKLILAQRSRKNSAMLRARRIHRIRKVAKSVKSYVKREIHRNIENKISTKQEVLKSVTSYANNTGMLCLPMIPYNEIVQGLGQSDRLGDTIKTRKVYFDFSLRPAPYDSQANFIPLPQTVIMMFGKVKNAKPQKPIATDFSKLFQFGNSSQAPQNRLLDNVLPINTDYFTVYRKLIFKIGNSITTGTGANLGSQYYANNEYKLNVTRRLDITKYVPKTVKFNDTTAQPTNDGLWMWAWCNNCDGTSNTFDPVPILMDYCVEYTYEDA